MPGNTFKNCIEKKNIIIYFNIIAMFFFMKDLCVRATAVIFLDAYGNKKNTAYYHVTRKILSDKITFNLFTNVDCPHCR